MKIKVQFLQKSHCSLHQQEAEQSDNEVLKELERMEDEAVVHDNNDSDVRENNDLDDDVRNRSFKNRV